MNEKIPITIEVTRQALEYLQLTGEVATCDLGEVVEFLAAEAKRRGLGHPGKLIAECKTESRLGPVFLRVRRNRHGFTLTEAHGARTEAVREEAATPEELHDLIDRPQHAQIRDQLKTLLVEEKKRELRRKIAAKGDVSAV